MASLDDISEWVNRGSAAEPLIALQPLSQVAPLPLSLPQSLSGRGGRGRITRWKKME